MTQNAPPGDPTAARAGTTSPAGWLACATGGGGPHGERVRTPAAAASTAVTFTNAPAPPDATASGAPAPTRVPDRPARVSTRRWGVCGATREPAVPNQPSRSTMT